MKTKDQEKKNALTTINVEADANTGFDEMTQEDYALPFLRVLTSTSPEIGVLEGAMPGMIFNSVTQELFDGKKGISVIPAAYIRQYIEWAPRGTGSSGAPVNIYSASSDILSKTHKEAGDYKDYLDNGNYIENTANHYVMVVQDGMPTPALIVMKSSQLKKSRQWNSMMLAAKRKGSDGRLFTPPPFANVYKLTTVQESNDKGKWFGWKVELQGSVEDQGQYDAAKSFAESIKSGNVNVKHSEEGADTKSEEKEAVPF
jgi:hypothetical protein